MRTIPVDSQSKVFNLTLGDCIGKRLVTQCIGLKMEGHFLDIGGII